MSLDKKKIAVFLEDFFEDTEFWYPYYRMKEEKAEVVVIAPEKKSYTGKNGTTATADMVITKAKPEKFDAVIIPGGYSPDKMRRSKEMIEFVKKMDQKKKLIAAICHAGWMLASAGIVNDKKLTSFFSIKDDMINAGANWVDKDVVIDGNLVTSRYPDDLPVFCKTLIDKLQNG
jgi:protease I